MWRMSSIMWTDEMKGNARLYYLCMGSAVWSADQGKGVKRGANDSVNRALHTELRGCHSGRSGWWLASVCYAAVACNVCSAVASNAARPTSRSIDLSAFVRYLPTYLLPCLSVARSDWRQSLLLMLLLLLLSRWTPATLASGNTWMRRSNYNTIIIIIARSKYRKKHLNLTYRYIQRPRVSRHNRQCLDNVRS